MSKLAGAVKRTVFEIDDPHWQGPGAFVSDLPWAAPLHGCFFY
jgi:hypothetical protein